jgi:NADH dehydrogenase
MFGADDRFLNLFAKLQSVLPVMPLAGADALFQPVWVEDVAKTIVTCLDRPESAGQTFECTGPQMLSLGDIVRLAGQWSGHARPVLPLPRARGWLQAVVLGWLPGQPLMSRDNLDSMRVPSVASGKLPGLRELGIVPAALDAAAPQYLGRATTGRGRLNLLRAGAGRG